MKGVTQGDKDRFWEKVDKKDEDECWYWTACIQSGGYGFFGLHHGELYLAHRFSWMLANNKEIPEDMFVCHSCDQPLCVNPAHLWLGTPKDNQRDSWNKGRNSNKGEDGGNSILTHDQVVQIKKAIAETKFEYGEKRAFCRMLADKYDVNLTSIHNIMYNLTWTHINV